MDFLNGETMEQILEYAQAHTSPEPPLLAKIHRETHIKVLNPRMISGHMQGRLLSLLSILKKPKYVLEIGTFTGYSALCLAEGLSENGKVFTVEINEELVPMIRNFFTEAGKNNQIELFTGDAREIIPLLNFVFDIVFLDADKEFYGEFYDLVFDKVAPGGLILADNVLWSGKVVKKTDATDKDTTALIRFNKKIQDDKRVENILLPVRDGIMIIRKL
jgi:caffeoyl-CoA O-methyltransferase